ncbi:MAG: D-2-hydroxyacid dehydrogenase [Chloroflexi bacterium]|nr:D-2-hydroxyacid dehydrogenase [Chloroflexota bacterium]
MAELHVLISARLAEAHLAAIRAVSRRIAVDGDADGVAFEPAAPGDDPAFYPAFRPEAEPLLRQAEVAFAARLPAGFGRRAPVLRWVQFTGAGVDDVWTDELRRSDVQVTTSGSYAPAPMAEHVLAMMLIFAKGWLRLSEQKRHRIWQDFTASELRHRTLSVVGLGKIGRAVARLGAELGMRVLGVRRSDSHEDVTGVQQVFPRHRLDEALAPADFVVLTAPLTAETYHLIGERELRHMKPTAHLINVARGPLVDGAALIRALREGWIAGAGLDVFEVEPLPASSPLWEMSNVLISPHMAARTERALDGMIEVFCENLRRYLAGEPLLNLVDKARGY